jgi:hypothetical protein
MEIIMNNYFTSTSSRGLFMRSGLAGLALSLFSGHSFAANVNLAWDASKSPNVGGYIVSYGETSGKYTSNIDVGNKTSVMITGAKEGATYYAAVKAYDSDRKTESGYSNEITKKIPVTSSTGGKTDSTNGGKAGGTDGGTTGATSGGSTGGTNGGTTGGTAKTKTDNNGLVAAFSFDEQSGDAVADASGKGNHGTIKEAVRIDKGRYGKALQFDGQNDWVTVNDSDSLDLTTGMTLEAWVFPQAPLAGGSGRTVIAKESPEGAAYNLYANNENNQPIATFDDGSNRHALPGPNQLPVNQWSHLVATYDGKVGRIYVNGIKVAEGEESSLIEPSNGVLRIGGSDNWGAFFKGYIDEVRIYNRALTAAEVQKDMKTAISASNPPKFAMGDQKEQPWIEYAAQGTAQAFQAVPAKSGMLTQVKVYLDASTTATQLVAGIYKDDNGHPGDLVAQGKLNTVKPEAWNVVPTAGAAVSAGKPYWIAIMGTNGEVGFLEQVGSGTGAMEKSTGRTMLKEMPKKWVGSKGGHQSNASMSIYGNGY